VSLTATVVRDLKSLSGAEVLADAAFFKKLQLDPSKTNPKEKERDRDTSDTLITGTSISSTAAHSNKFPVSRKDAIVPNIRFTKAQEEYGEGEPAWYLRKDDKLQAVLSYCGGQSIYDEEFEPHNYDTSFDHSSDISSEGESDCSSCMDYTSCSDEDAEAQWAVRSEDAHIRKVRGRNTKFWQRVNSQDNLHTEEDVLRIRKLRELQHHPDDDLNKWFPGGADHAHKLAKQWARKAKEDKLEKLKQEKDKEELDIAKKVKKADDEFERLFGSDALDKAMEKELKRLKKIKKNDDND